VGEYRDNLNGFCLGPGKPDEVHIVLHRSPATEAPHQAALASNPIHREALQELGRMEVLLIMRAEHIGPVKRRELSDFAELFPRNKYWFGFVLTPRRVSLGLHAPHPGWENGRK
jgi:hypothetical protein